MRMDQMAKKDKEKKDKQEEQSPTLEEMQAQNLTLIKQLTNKNEDYVVKLNRHLKELGWDDDQVTEAFYDMLPNIVKEQDNGVLARKLYGPVTEQADRLTAGPNRQTQAIEKSPTWQLYVDGALLLGGLLALINGVLQLFTNTEAQNPMGIVTLLVNFLLAGVAILVIGNYAPVPGQKGGFLKYILASVLTMVVWMLAFSFIAALIPPSINPPLSPAASIIIGIIALVAKYFFKRSFNVQGSLI